jgi:GDP-L-fucose synthase
MNCFKNKKVLVTGGSGMIGRQLVNLLIEKDAKVYVADLNEPLNMPKNINFIKVDLKDFSSCKNICKGMDFVFNLVGIKTSPKICMEKPASIIGPMLQFNTNMLEAAMSSNIEWYLYTSSVGVYQPAPILKEDDVENTVPSRNDWFGGWAKRIGEMQIQAYEIQNQVSNCSIVRPANVYGPYDNFDTNNAMVIPSLIRKAEENEILSVWGDGSPVRDFIYAKDVARGMIFAVENKISKPLNLGSGNGISIKEIAETVAAYFKKSIEWDVTKPSGDPVRILDMTRANSFGYQTETNIQSGIIDTIEWYLANKDIIDLRYNVFTSRG